MTLSKCSTLIIKWLSFKLYFTKFYLILGHAKSGLKLGCGLNWGFYGNHCTCQT